MTFENTNTDDFFPLLQQTLSDTFKIDSYLMHAPYQNFEKMDMGLRRMVWGNYKTNSPLFFLCLAALLIKSLYCRVPLGFTM